MMRQRRDDVERDARDGERFDIKAAQPPAKQGEAPHRGHHQRKAQQVHAGDPSSNGLARVGDGSRTLDDGGAAGQSARMAEGVDAQEKATDSAEWIRGTGHDRDQGVLGQVQLLQKKTFSTQPVASFDWNSDKEGLCVMGCLDQTVRVLICTKLNLL